MPFGEVPGARHSFALVGSVGHRRVPVHPPDLHSSHPLIDIDISTIMNNDDPKHADVNNDFINALPLKMT